MDGRRHPLREGAKFCVYMGMRRCVFRVCGGDWNVVSPSRALLRVSRAEGFIVLAVGCSPDRMLVARPEYVVHTFDFDVIGIGEGMLGFFVNEKGRVF